MIGHEHRCGECRQLLDAGCTNASCLDAHLRHELCLRCSQSAAADTIRAHALGVKLG